MPILDSVSPIHKCLPSPQTVSSLEPGCFGCSGLLQRQIRNHSCSCAHLYTLDAMISLFQHNGLFAPPSAHFQVLHDLTIHASVNIAFPNHSIVPTCNLSQEKGDVAP